MRLLLLLFATWLFLASATPPRHRHKRQAGSGPSPKPILQATMNTFSSGVALRDRALVLKVFNWPNPNEQRMNDLFNRFIGLNFIVNSAAYMSGRRIEGIVQSYLNTTRGSSDTTFRIVLRPASESPTNWKIFSVKPLNINRPG